MADLSSVTQNYFATSSETFEDNLSATIAAGATTVSLNNLSEYTDGDVVVLTVDPGTALEATFTGVKSGTTVTDVKWTEGNTGVGHDAGATVVDYDSATHFSMATKGIKQFANQDGTLKEQSVRDALSLGATDTAGWETYPYAISAATYNGNRSYDLTTASSPVSFLSPGMRLRTQRTSAAPTQSTSLNGTSQYWSKTSPAGMTFTDDFTVSAWVKMTSYAQNTIVSRYNGTSGWMLKINSGGVVELIGLNGASSNSSRIASYQSVPLNKWVHITAQLDMSAFTATTTTSYIMIDGVDVPATVTRAGTNPTSLVQAGNLEVGSNNSGADPFPGKIAQVAIFSAKVDQATMRGYISQGIPNGTTSLISHYSFNGVATDTNTTNANNLTANGSATATNADSPFGGQASGTISSTLDYGIVQKVTATTITVQVAEGCTIPTTGGVTAASYSTYKSPYGFPSQKGKWTVLLYTKSRQTVSTPSAGTYYNVNGLYLTLPVGEWVLSPEVEIFATRSPSGVTEITFGLSTTTTSAGLIPETGGTAYANPLTDHMSHLSRRVEYAVSVATPIYLIVRTSQSSHTSINLAGEYGTGTGDSVAAENAYL